MHMQDTYTHTCRQYEKPPNHIHCAQVNIPIATVDGCPVGLGIIGPTHSDEALLKLTQQLAAQLQLPV